MLLSFAEQHLKLNISSRVLNTAEGVSYDYCHQSDLKGNQWCFSMIEHACKTI